MEESKSHPALIIDRIKRFFAPPTFEDEENMRTARILGIILWAIIGVLGTLLFIWLITGRSSDLGPYAYIANAVIVIAAISLLFLIRHGHVSVASYIFISFLWLNLTFQAFTSDGVRGSAPIIYMTIMILAGLLLGWRASIGFSALSTVSIWVLAHAETAGFTIFQPDQPYQVAIETTGIFVLAAILLTLTMKGLTNALGRARNSEQSLKETNIALHNNLAELASREKALRESEERFRLLAENVVDNIWILNPRNLTFIYASPSAEKITGYTHEELLGLSLDQLLTPDSVNVANSAFAENFEQFKNDPSLTRSLELELYHRNGSTVWVETSARVLYIHWLSSHGILGVTRDISDRKKADSERKELQSQLLQSQKMEAIGTLAGGIAHDFNNSLQGILGYSQILISEKNQADPDLQKMVQIEKAAKRASELTKQLLMFSRKVESQLRPLDLNQEIRQSENLLERTIPKMVSIETRLGDNLRIINGDPVQIEQMIMNICINARDAMPDGGRLIIESRETFLDAAYCNFYVDIVPGEYVMLKISDNGSGMDRETLEHIFEPFYTTKKTGKGTGLGLSMVYGIVKNHGGHITCNSEPAKGTTFEIYFPVIEEIPADHLDQEDDSDDVPHGVETILLVDDEDYLRELGYQMLSRFGYSVLTAPDGETALEIFQENNHDIALIIMDLIMPGMGGKACIQKMLKLDPNTKVIIASGYSVDSLTKEKLDSMAKGYISKPFELKQMLGLVRDVLDES